MFLATTYDKSSEAWTASSPTPLVSILIFSIRCTHPFLVIQQLEYVTMPWHSGLHCQLYIKIGNLY